MSRDVENLGQVFTPDHVVKLMLSLRKRRGRTLEPSAGDGAFARHLRNCVAIEVDSRVASADALVMDFFAYPLSEKFSCVIGNPPYVRHQDILPETRNLLQHDLFDGRTNLYLYFIEKCVRHLKPGGELIFITPRDFQKATAAKKLNAWLYREGTITDFIETGDSTIFGAYVPNCAIFRFEKGLMDRRMTDGRIFTEVDGQLMFLKDSYNIPLSSLFDVKVGAVSGADDIFTHPAGNMEFVCSKTIDSGMTRRMLYCTKHPDLQIHKDRLIGRRIRPFTEANWWHWGRAHHISDRPRIYVNSKTRRQEPFFLHPCKNYDGSVLALFPRDATMDLELAVKLLNAVRWEELGFVCDGRHLFSQRSLATCVLPEVFAQLQPGQIEPA